MRRHPLLKRLAVVLGATMCLVLAPVAEATVQVQLSRAELVQRADLVVRATVASQASTWNESHTQIRTITQLRVSAYLKGTGPLTLALRQLGGSVDNLRMDVPGDARLAPGQDVVVFLRQGVGVVYLSAMAQSVYYIQPSATGVPTVQRNLHDLAFARLSQSGMTLQEAPDEPPESLDHLARDIVTAGGAR